MLLPSFSLSITAESTATKMGYRYKSREVREGDIYFTAIKKHVAWRVYMIPPSRKSLKSEDLSMFIFLYFINI
jgi:hypothetical protein